MTDFIVVCFLFHGCPGGIRTDHWADTLTGTEIDTQTDPSTGPERSLHSELSTPYSERSPFYSKDSESVSIINCEVFPLLLFNAMMNTKQLEPTALRDVVIVSVSECVCLFKCGNVQKLRIMISQGCVPASRERPRLHRQRAGVSRS